MAIEKGTESQGDGKSAEPSNAELIALIKQQQKDIEELKKLRTSNDSGNTGIADAIASAFKKYDDSKDINFQEGIRLDQIPKEDILSVPVLFFAPCAGTFIFDDKINGFPVKAPYNTVVEFEYVTTRFSGKGRDAKSVPLSRYKCYSKSICEFLRNHSGYGVRFYESAEGIDDKTLKLAARTAEIISVVKGYEIGQLLEVAKSYNVPFSQDYNSVRGALAMAMANAEIEKEMERQKESLEQTHKLMLAAGRA